MQTPKYEAPNFWLFCNHAGNCSWMRIRYILIITILSALKRYTLPYTYCLQISWTRCNHLSLLSKMLRIHFRYMLPQVFYIHISLFFTLIHVFNFLLFDPKSGGRTLERAMREPPLPDLKKNVCEFEQIRLEITSTTKLH